MSMIARTDVTNPSTEDWVNVFGPDGYNVQPDTNRNRKMGRVHLPDVLKVATLLRFETRRVSVFAKSDNVPLWGLSCDNRLFWPRSWLNHQQVETAPQIAHFMVYCVQNTWSWHMS